MLSEARARLANTMGKKAKRKARERQMEETKRMASILKRRDMTDTTITAKQRKKWRNQMDYTADIPFHKTVPIGFHDISEEMAKEDFEKRTLIAQSLEKEAKRKLQQEEADNQQGGQQKQKQAKTSEDISSAALQAIKEAEEMSLASRKKLVLPAPQMSDSELQEILKIGKTGSAAKALVESAASYSQDFSKGLLAEYDNSIATSSFRTPMQPANEDNLKMQARNLKAMTESQTPLLGDSVSLEGNIEFKGATPKNAVLATPNPMAVHLTPKIHADGGNSTPRIQGSSISRTPLRDQMGINQAGSSRSEFGDDSSVAGTPRATSGVAGSHQQSIMRSQLKSLFSELPKPKNDFEVVIPDQPSKKAKGVGIVDDSETVMAREEAARLEEEAREFRKRSSAVQRDLPRPSVISIKKTNDAVQNLILEETERMMSFDAVKFPYPGQRPVSFDIKSFQEYSEEDLNAAAALIDQELIEIEKTLKRMDFCAAIEAQYDSLHSEYLYVPKPKPRYVHLPSLSDQEKVEIYSILIENYRELIKHDSIMAQKLEQKANILFGGYEAKCEAYSRQIIEVYKDLEDAEIEYNSFLMLKQMEEEAIPIRLERAKREYDTLVLKNRDMQERYAELKADKTVIK
jgi:pre-mRNA-splicing factor CDC5/CEF1